ncbi:hypothetical protein F511_26581 [Dorcoceras hygrometricum]|uniref:Uncharacterized protein n=1 Tax=Dorcoceras hygrometricum TaxID=472368 RepID=A0A2Z7AG37_9LAMI|nr:hypothetical protein F511_26581 [Dorcoceras hygrometricum]
MIQMLKAYPKNPHCLLPIFPKFCGQNSNPRSSSATANIKRKGQHFYSKKEKCPSGKQHTVISSSSSRAFFANHPPSAPGM